MSENKEVLTGDGAEELLRDKDEISALDPQRARYERHIEAYRQEMEEIDKAYRRITGQESEEWEDAIAKGIIALLALIGLVTFLGSSPGAGSAVEENKDVGIELY